MNLYLPLFEFARIYRIPMIALNVEAQLTRAIGDKGWDATRWSLHSTLLVVLLSQLPLTQATSSCRPSLPPCTRPRMARVAGRLSDSVRILASASASGAWLRASVLSVLQERLLRRSRLVAVARSAERVALTSAA